jgi:hypothetical protein
MFGSLRKLLLEQRAASRYVVSVDERGEVTMIPAESSETRFETRRHAAGFTLDSYDGTFPAQHREAAAKLAAMVDRSRT